MTQCHIALRPTEGMFLHHWNGPASSDTAIHRENIGSRQTLEGYRNSHIIKPTVNHMKSIDK